MSKHITGHTGLLCLLGSPVAHSVSPEMHNEACDQLGLDYSYLAFDVPEDKMPQAVEGLRAACFASNFVVSVCYKATELLQECGFSKSESESALSTLMKCNMDNILKVGCEKAITGPAARGDMATIEKHIEVLDERTRELYKELTNVIFDMKNGGIE